MKKISKKNQKLTKLQRDARAKSLLIKKIDNKMAQLEEELHQLQFELDSYQAELKGIKVKIRKLLKNK